MHLEGNRRWVPLKGVNFTLEKHDGQCFHEL